MTNFLLSTPYRKSIYQAALQEGGTVTLWHGGDERNQQDALKEAFEARFPGMTLNLTVDLSKYHDGLIDQQLADGDVYVDSVALQTSQDYPRWKEEGVLLNYAPKGFDEIHPAFKDADAAYYGVRIFAWEILWNKKKLDNSSIPLRNFGDFLNPALKDKIVLTYPNDDDAVLYAFDLIMRRLGASWFDALLTQNITWVRGTATPGTLVNDSSTPYAASFTSFCEPPLGCALPSDAYFVSWAQTAAILKDAPHPEAAKLLHNFWVSKEYLEAGGPTWTVRTDMPEVYPSIFEQPNTDPSTFASFMADRVAVERLRFWFEKKLGTAQGLSPLDDNV